MSAGNFEEVSTGFFVNADFAERLAKLGLTSIDAVFQFEGGTSLDKPNLARHRTRIQLGLQGPDTTVFLKRYDNPPKRVQLQNWLSHKKRVSTSDLDWAPANELAGSGINTPSVVAYGCQWSGLFERRSFVITEKIPGGQSMEKKLPDCFLTQSPIENVSEKRQFLNKIADFARQFHDTGFRHRDFYLAHIFLTPDERFYLIDLQRTFKPGLLGERFRIKDIAQLHYSTPGNRVSRCDRLRFYMRYTGRNKLSSRDRRFLRSINARVWRMADHDIRHERPVPFAK